MQLLSYWAPGNIYSQRGTLSFFWRSRTPVDETAFPVFRVGFADHSSWDMVWLRIDWNGHGFDAFVTDVNLGRTRVSVKLPEDPQARRVDAPRACVGRDQRHPLLHQRQADGDERGHRPVRHRARPVRPALARHRTHRR